MIPKKPTCMTPNCKYPQKSRGLCVTCASECARLVREGVCTDDETVARGLRLARGAGAKKRKSRFLQALERAREEGTGLLP